MTFTELVEEVVDRMNLGSAQAQARIGRAVNERYRELATSMGLQTVGQTTVTATTTVGSRYLAFAGQKILSVFNTAVTPSQPLIEVLFDELRNQVEGSDPPQQYAIARTTATTVTVFLDCTPATEYALSADVLANMTTLSGQMTPAFAEDFHNLLVYGAMATEYDKQEKLPLSAKYEKRYQDRLSELRLFLAKSQYLDIYQGKTASNSPALTVPLV